jgi:hypothetical protein
VRSALLHGSETWAPTASDLQRLCRNDRAMIAGSVGPSQVRIETPTALFCARLGNLQEVTEALRIRRLKWYGHVMRSSVCIDTITNMKIPCPGKLGRPRKIRSQCIKEDLRSRNHTDNDPRNRAEWRLDVNLRDMVNCCLPLSCWDGHGRGQIKHGGWMDGWFQSYRSYLCCLIISKFIPLACKLLFHG